MTHQRFTPPFVPRCAAVLLAAHCACALAQNSSPTHATIEVVAARGRLTAQLPDANALNARGTWVFDDGDVFRAEILDERKFDSHGGIAGIGYTRVVSPDWYVAGNLALGHGGPNWATTRVDVELSTKWTEQRDIVTRVALYRARFDGHRGDHGLRLGLVGYLPGSVVLETGVAFNISEPGAVRSRMPFISATIGSEGVQYLSLRASRGSEAYQAIGAGQQLVDFNSRGVGVTWRRWVDRQWGFVLQAEFYRNPTYERTTLGTGIFVQW